MNRFILPSISSSSSSNPLFFSKISNKSFQNNGFMVVKIMRQLSSTPTTTLTGKPTALKSRHVQAKGQLVDFAGYQLPVLFDGRGVMKEHLHTREAASVFDVSHMGQVRIMGDKKDRIDFLLKLVVSDITKLQPGQSMLTVMCNEQGGIIDDCIVSDAGDHHHVVVNGACKHGDLKHMKSLIASTQAKLTLDMLSSDETILVAIQGPKAASSLQKLLPSSLDLKTMDFMTFKDSINIAGVSCRLARCGYTGEDGFEISARKDGGKMYDALLSLPDVAPAGLGARDSLRLEAGLCLYGHDLNEKTRPFEASLGWLVDKNRNSNNTFIGYNQVMEQHTNPTGTIKQKRVGFVIPIGAPAREGTLIYTSNHPQNTQSVGIITSGTFSPTLKKPIAMGYVDVAQSKIGTEVFVEVRGKRIKAEVTKMPFVPTHYYRVKSGGK
jgi:aminomethyltransferase